MKFKFNNKQNIRHTSKETGEDVWAGRNVAVAVRFTIRKRKTGHPRKHLVVQRGKDVNHIGEWCFPCGYLDFNETTKQAAQRELYEETGILIMDLDSFTLVEVVDDPSRDELENITFHYDVSLVDPSGRDNLALRQYETITKRFLDANPENGEVTDIMFVEKPEPLKFAFNHEKRFRL